MNVAFPSPASPVDQSTVTDELVITGRTMGELFAAHRVRDAPAGLHLIDFPGQLYSNRRCEHRLHMLEYLQQRFTEEIMMQKNSELLSTFSNQLADAVERAGTSVVTVHGRQRHPASGVVCDQELVLTADHVLEREEELTVETEDERVLPAQFLGRDLSSDLAVLHVANLGRPVAERLQTPARVGQIVLAVGRPFREGPMASLGIICATGGPLRTRRGTMLERFLRTDAIPYPGFSGGPLVTASGQVVGILTTGLVNGVALAIPAATAWRIGESLAREGRVKRGYLGISSQPVQLPTSQRPENKQAGGLLIVGVEEGSPAAQGGLLVGDILVTLDGNPVDDTADLQLLLTGERVGQQVTVEVIRGAKSQSLQARIGER